MSKRLTPVLAYLRVSTDRQERSGLSIEDQRRSIAQFATARGWEVVEEYQETASGKTLARRPALRTAIARLEDASAGESRPRALVVAKLDRLARSMLDYAVMVERAQRGDWNLALVDPELDLSTPFGRAMANMIMTFAQLEREMIGQRVSAANRSKRARGEHVGRPKGTREIAPAAIARMHDLRADGMAYSRIAETLAAEGVKTARGGKWAGETVRQVVTGTTSTAAGRK